MANRIEELCGKRKIKTTKDTEITEKDMHKDKQKHAVYGWKTVMPATIASIVLYFGSITFIYGKEYNLPWRMISSKLAVFIVLGFDITWCGIILLCPFCNRHAKIILTVLVLTLSAIILTDLYLIAMWHNMW